MYHQQNANDYQKQTMMVQQLLFIEIREQKERHGDMHKICYFCLNVKPTFVDPNSGQRICSKCFSGNYKKRKAEPLVYTYKDLKDHFEKNWQ
jgi:hypothetical protein